MIGYGMDRDHAPRIVDGVASARKTARELAVETLTPRQADTLRWFEMGDDPEYAKDITADAVEDMEALSAKGLVARVRTGGDTIYCPIPVPQADPGVWTDGGYLPSILMAQPPMTGAPAYLVDGVVMGAGEYATAVLAGLVGGHAGRGC